MMPTADLWIVVALLLQAAPSATPAPQPVAIVSALQGSASVRQKTGAAHPLALYDWVLADATVEVNPEGRVELILIDGRRYALAAGARAKLSPGTVTPLHGEATQEAAMPRLVALVPIAGKAPRAAGAVRVRGRSVPKLNPCETVRTLRDQTILRFETVEGAARYQVEVRNSGDEQVFARTIDRPPVAIPADVLVAGAEYVWTVRAEGRIPPASSEARFTTLDASSESARRSLASTLDPQAIGLLGGIDAHLGLLNEATVELTDAVQRTSGDPATEAALKRARAALAAACQ